MPVDPLGESDAGDAMVPGATPEDLAAISTAKRLLRKAVLLRRDARPEAERRTHDLARMALIERVLASVPDTVACYLSTGSEPGTRRLVAWLAARDVRVLLPLLTMPNGSWRSEPAWADYTGPDNLRAGRASILEPTGRALPVTEITRAELIICPALAASGYGDRLGRGGGWYDRALAQAAGRTSCALLNDDEVVPQVPAQPWDRRVDLIITPTKIIDCVLARSEPV